MKEVGITDDFIKHDIKFDAITEVQIDRMRDLSGSYESLFSRKGRKYKVFKLNERELSEKEIRALILSEYTFLKRPVVIIGSNIFIGNASKDTTELKTFIAKS